MKHAVRRGVAIPATLALTLGLGGVAVAATDPAVPPTFTKTAVDPALTGAAFVVSGDVSGDVRPEIVASQFGPYAGPAPAGPGTVQLYNNAARNAAPGGPINSWTKTTIVPQSAGIYGPNQATLADVDLDGDVDVIVPGGNFFQSYLKALLPNLGGGTLTWWENRANGGTWIRHDIIADSTFTGPPTAASATPPIPSTTTRNFSFHGVQHADMDGDGIADLITVGEDAGNPGQPDDVVATLFLKGLGGGDFAAPVTLAGLGGSLPVVADVNADGKNDIVSAQFFGNVAGQPFIPSFARGAAESSFIWLQQGDDGVPGLSAADFTARKIGAAEGPSFQIIPVANFRGDGITRWIGTNHTNKNVPFPPFSLYPAPAVYEFTPQADPTLPWTAVQLTAPGAFTVTGGVGQAAPGGVGSGDLDGDGDIDLAVSGDGDRRVFWLEQKGDGSFALNQMPGSTGFGQAGGNVVIDLNRDGKNEAIWGSFDAGQVALWQR
jgi:hypothetical protein